MIQLVRKKPVRADNRNRKGISHAQKILREEYIKAGMKGEERGNLRDLFKEGGEDRQEIVRRNANRLAVQLKRALEKTAKEE